MYINIYTPVTFDRTTGEGCTSKRERGPHLFRKMKTMYLFDVCKRGRIKAGSLLCSTILSRSEITWARSPFRVCSSCTHAPRCYTSYGRKFPGRRSRAIKRKITTNGRSREQEQLLLGELFISSFAASCKTEPAFSFIEPNWGRFLGDSVDRQSAYGFNYAGLSTLWLRSSPITASFCERAATAIKKEPNESTGENRAREGGGEAGEKIEEVEEEKEKGVSASGDYIDRRFAYQPDIVRSSMDKRILCAFVPSVSFESSCINVKKFDFILSQSNISQYAETRGWCSIDSFRSRVYAINRHERSLKPQLVSHLRTRVETKGIVSRGQLAAAKLECISRQKRVLD